MKTLRRAGVCVPEEVVFFGLLDLLGNNLPAWEIDAVCQGYTEFVTFSRGWGLLSPWQAEV